MFDKVNDDSSQKMFTAIFHAKKQELKQEDKVYRFHTDFLKGLILVDFWDINRSNMVGIPKVM